METINKADFAGHISASFGFPINMAEKIVDVVFGEIIESLKRGDEVKIKNFGAFGVRSKPERPGRNPRTGRPATIAARRVPVFHPADEFRELIKKSDL